MSRELGAARPRTNAKIPPVLWVLLSGLAFVAIISPNPIIGIFAVAIAVGVSIMLWRPAEPQVLLFVVGFQWLQAFAPVLLALLAGERIATLYGRAEFETAAILSLLGTGVFALGLKVATRRAAPFQQVRFVEGLWQLDEKRLLKAWLVLTVVNTGLGIVGASIMSLRQFFIPIEIWKWAAVLLLFFRWLASGQGGRVAVYVLAVELLIGMLGYFSAFREVIFILLLALSGVFAIGRKKMGALIATTLLLFIFLGFWQAIKGRYREFLSRGARAQVVRVSIPERVRWLAIAASETDFYSLVEGTEGGLSRLEYITFFGHALHAVPERIPHTKGQLWKEAVLHPLTPRLLFPDKPAIHDSDRTNAYTGITVAGAGQGASISIGYMGESYIDFGRMGMFVPIFIWGWLVGWCFEFLRRKAPHPLVGTSLASCLLLSTAMLLESSNIKMMGSLVAGFLVTAVLMHFYGEKAWRWLIAERPSAYRRFSR